MENSNAITDGPAAEFVRRVFDSMPRMDQRRWAGIYLRGLMTVPGRKSLRNIADHTGIGSGVQSLQQFINQSPWRWKPVRRAIGELVEERTPILAWSLEHTIIPKRGDHSVGVERRFSTALGRTVNCQVAAGLYLVGDSGSVAATWRLLLSDKWTRPGERRRRARIPDRLGTRSEQQLVVDMVDELTGWGLPRRPVLVNLAHEVNPVPLLEAFEEHGIDYIAEVPAHFEVIAGAHLHEVLPGERASWDRRIVTVQDSVRPRGLERSQVASSRDAGGSAQVASTLVRLALPGMAQNWPVLRVIGMTSRSAAAPRYWVTNLARRPVPELTRLIRLKTRDERQLEPVTDQYGVRDFEGRSFPGWHHHMTLVSAAQAARLLGMDKAAETPISDTRARTDLPGYSRPYLSLRAPRTASACAADAIVMWWCQP